MLSICGKCTVKQEKKNEEHLVHSVNHETQKVVLENVKQTTLQYFFIVPMYE